MLITDKNNVMIFLTQLIYIKSGQEAVFNEFESIAIPIISNYNGQLILRVRPEKSAYIESTVEMPYEIHLVKFNSEKDLQNFMLDEERKKFIHLKEQSIDNVVLIKGISL